MLDLQHPQQKCTIITQISVIVRNQNSLVSFSKQIHTLEHKKGLVERSYNPKSKDRQLMLAT